MKKVHFYENEKETRWNDELSNTAVHKINADASFTLCILFFLFFLFFLSIAIVSTYKRQKLIHSHIITSFQRSEG